MYKTWIIVALDDVGKPYIHSSYDSIIDALQMHYRLVDDKLNNQIVELEL